MLFVFAGFAFGAGDEDGDAEDDDDEDDDDDGDGDEAGDDAAASDSVADWVGSVGAVFLNRWSRIALILGSFLLAVFLCLALSLSVFLLCVWNEMCDLMRRKQNKSLPLSFTSTFTFFHSITSSKPHPSS